MKDVHGMDYQEMDYQEKVRELLEVLFKFKNLTRMVNFFEMLSFNEMAVFRALKKLKRDNPETPNVKMGDISKLLKISKPALTQIVNKLEDKGLVKRISMEDDRRVTLIELTEKGSELFRKEDEYVLKITEKIVQSMGEDDTERFIYLLQKLFNIINTEIISQ